MLDPYLLAALAVVVLTFAIYIAILCMIDSQTNQTHHDHYKADTKSEDETQRLS